MILYTCKRCNCEFMDKHWRQREYCSHACANRHPPKYQRTDLEQLARNGATGRTIARTLGLEVNTVRKALIREGLHREWALARFKKCRQVA